ncbi:MAG TPA: hypothetical protein VK281_17185 [Xanthobacteraceae bacterium]|nr:hypothetical protein [Xanthobacteraceae bacterium]
MWQRALAWSRHSATHLWANLVIAVSVAAEAAAHYADQISGTVADLVGDPELKTQLLALVPHDTVPLVIIGIMVVTKLARNRSMAK